MDLRGKLRKAAGLFVEIPEEEPGAEAAEASASVTGPTDAATDDLDRRLAAMNATIRSLGAGGSGGGTPPPAAARTVEQIVREADGPNLDEVNVPASAPAPVMSADGRIDFSALYAQAALPAAPFTAEQTLDMLASLPGDLPLDTRRQTVKVTLGAMGKAIGATPETIVADASRKLAALAAYSENVSNETAQTVTAGELEIAALQQQIEQVRQSIGAAQQRHSEVQRLCEAETDRLDDVLEFFSLDIGPSRHAAAATNTAGGA
jgi:hypothetical protein